MHEMAIAESIIDIVTAKAESDGFTRVKEIRIEVGEMTGVVPDSLRFSFGFVSRGTLADGAELRVARLPITAACRGCGKGFTVKGIAFKCPHCGAASFHITGGKELRIVELDVDSGGG